MHEFTRARTHYLRLSLSASLSSQEEEQNRKVTGERRGRDRERERERGERYSVVSSLQEARSDFSARSTRSRELKSTVSTFTFSSYTTPRWYVSGECATSPGLNFEASSSFLLLLLLLLLLFLFASFSIFSFFSFFPFFFVLFSFPFFNSFPFLPLVLSSFRLLYSPVTLFQQ